MNGGTHDEKNDEWNIGSTDRNDGPGKQRLCGDDPHEQYRGGQKAPVGSEVVVRSGIIEELPSGTFLVRDASGYLLMEVDRSAPYYASLEQEMLLVKDRDQGEDGHKTYVRTIADPNRIVQITGTIMEGRNGPVLHAELITPLNPASHYSDAYNRSEGFNS